MINQFPLISCICVTNNKPHMLDRAISCFRAQSYNNKQLLILYEDTDFETNNYITSIVIPSDIKVITVDTTPKKPLGELRNIAIKKADGEYVCQWDDDDWYHMDRLTIQYKAIVENDVSGSILSRWLIYNSLNQQSFISNRRRWEGSILCKKSILSLHQYDNIYRGEDTSVIEYLHNNNYLISIDNSPGLYIYIYHGKNTWHLEHFEEIFKASIELSNKSHHIEQILAGNYNSENYIPILSDYVHMTEY